MILSSHQNTNSIILGLGKTGISCIRHFIRQNKSVTVMDTRQDPPGLAELQSNWPLVPIHLGGFDEDLMLQAKEIIVSPGLSLQEPAIAKAISRGVSVIGDIELFARHATAPIVAITGSNAKGTVTTLVGEMARKAGLNVRVGGNIGIPALDLLTGDEPDLYVLELSSFQLETTSSLSPTAAVILNISADHLDRYSSIEAYADAKQRIYQHARAVVYNRDDKQTFPRIQSRIPAFTFGVEQPAPNEFGLAQQNHREFLAFGDQLIMPVSELKIKGRHNVANALAALALGTHVNIPLEAMVSALKQFTGLPHRCEWVADHEGISWYDDSKGTNIGATLAAIEGLGEGCKGKIILIAGGMGKGADFTTLRQAVSQYTRAVILIGQDAPLLRGALNGLSQLYDAKDMLEAVRLARQSAKPGDLVLLSPACASYDMFENYEHRGEVFTNTVRSLIS